MNYSGMLQNNVEDNIETTLLGLDLDSRTPLWQHDSVWIRVPARLFRSGWINPVKSRRLRRVYNRVVLRKPPRESDESEESDDPDYEERLRQHGAWARNSAQFIKRRLAHAAFLMLSILVGSLLLLSWSRDKFSIWLLVLQVYTAITWAMYALVTHNWADSISTGSEPDARDTI